MSASTENRYSKSTEAPKNLQRIHEISSNHASEQCATLLKLIDSDRVPAWAARGALGGHCRLGLVDFVCAASSTPRDGSSA